MHAQKLIIKIFTYIFLIIMFAFAVWKLFPIVSGPKIIIFSPANGTVIETPTYEVYGQVLRAKSVKIMDRNVTIDEKGNFRETFISQKPYNTVYITALDKWGRTVETKIITEAK